MAELTRRALEGGRLPQTGGVRPQLTVTVDLDGLLGRHGSLGGEAGGAGPLDPEACQRLACDGALTRVLVTRHPTGHRGPGTGGRPATRVPSGEGGLAARLRAAVALLPPVLGGAPAEPLEVGRTSRVVLPAQRTALAVRDGGCVFPGCSRPLAWCEAHHLWHWLHGGPTDLANMALLCRAHHRAVHEGGWRLQRQPDGRLTAAPPHRRHRAAA
ncbi:MAG TPA: HNH endonuclease signature motif containing protein [Actinomycetota bacterium]